MDMKRLWLLLLLIPLLIPGPAKSQVNPQTGHGAPSGPCLGPYTDIDTGNFYVCKVGQYALAGGSSVSPTGIPGTAGVTAVPVTSGLMAEYRMFPTETCAGLLDYSGNGNNATGTVGTAPTIIPVTGGCNFTGNGAVSLPASLNSALTVIAYISFQSTGVGATGTNAILMGNGAGTNAGGNGMWLTSCNPTGGGGPCNGWTSGGGVLGDFGPNTAFFSTWGSNQFNTLPAITFNGFGSFAEAMTPTGDILYLNGNTPGITGFRRNPGSAGEQTTGNYQLGGAASNIGNNAGAATWFNGKIYYLAFYNRALTASEIAQDAAFLQAQMNLRGITPPFPSNPATPLLSGSDALNQLVATGTSITAGNGLVPWTTTIANGLNGGPWNSINLAISGTTTTTISQQAPFLVDSALRPIANKNVFVFEASTNDSLSTQALAANAVGLDRQFCNARKAIGGKCVIISGIDRNSAAKNLYNTELRLRWRTFADGFADVGASVLGVDGNGVNTTLVSDGIHPTQYGIHNVYEPVVQRAVNRVYGNLSFSEATTYVAAALAATATTAGTESGNTITITFGATPANCLQGNMITLSGITPVGLGYNDTFLILTRSATQITAWSSVTGLGAITVQGTGSCTQMQDADVYSIVNFTGNYTLQTCVGYTGQNIYIRNINAGAVTLVPMPTSTFTGTAETITGAGATPTTLAANTTAILQSQLVSSAAAGCNWVRLQ